MSKTSSAARTWDIAAIVVAVLLLVAAWFLLISPVLAEASETNAQTEDQEAKNDIAQQQVTALGKDFAKIDEYRADLETLREQITTTQRYADLQRLVAQVAEDNNVIVKKLEFGTGEVVDAPEPVVEEEPEATEEEESEPADSATEEDEVETAPKPLFQGLFSIEVDIELSGTYSDVLAAIEQLQTGEDRIVLITSVALSPDTDEETVGIDAITAELSGETFVLIDLEALKRREDTEPNVEPSATPEPLPASEENPLGSVGN